MLRFSAGITAETILALSSAIPQGTGLSNFPLGLDAIASLILASPIIIFALAWGLVFWALGIFAIVRWTLNKLRLVTLFLVAFIEVFVYPALGVHDDGEDYI
jgi:hypothetical protein